MSQSIPLQFKDVETYVGYINGMSISAKTPGTENSYSTVSWKGLINEAISQEMKLQILEIEEKLQKILSNGRRLAIKEQMKIFNRPLTEADLKNEKFCKTSQYTQYLKKIEEIEASQVTIEVTELLDFRELARKKFESNYTSLFKLFFDIKPQAKPKKK